MAKSNVFVSKSLYSSLMNESKNILIEIQSLNEHNLQTEEKKKITKIRSSFKSLIRYWMDFRKSALIQIAAYQEKLVFFQSESESRRNVDKQLKIKRRSLRSKEKAINLTHRLAGKSLKKISRFWKSELKDMKKIISTQEIKKQLIGQSIEEFNSRQSCSSIIGSTSLLEGPSIDKIIVQDTPDINESVEFEIEMNKLLEDKQQRGLNPFLEGSQVSRSGWKSDLDSENESFLSISPGEIKSAIQILKKANLLNPDNQDIFNNITSMLKEPESSQNLEFFLQLLHLQKKSLSEIENPDELKSKIIEISKEESKNSQIFEKFVDKALGLSQEDRNFGFDSGNENKINFPELTEIDFYESRFNSETDKGKNTDLQLGQSSIEHLYQNKIPVKRNTFEYQSTGISSQTGLRSRITLKTGGSEASQKVLTHDSKTIEETFEEI